MMALSARKRPSLRSAPEVQSLARPDTEAASVQIRSERERPRRPGAGYAPRSSGTREGPPWPSSRPGRRTACHVTRWLVAPTDFPRYHASRRRRCTLRSAAGISMLGSAEPFPAGRSSCVGECNGPVERLSGVNVSGRRKASHAESALREGTRSRWAVDGTVARCRWERDPSSMEKPRSTRKPTTAIEISEEDR